MSSKKRTGNYSGKRKGFKGWKRINSKEFTFHLNKNFRVTRGEAVILQKHGKWYGRIHTDVRGVFFKPAVSPPFPIFTDALKWLNKRRREVSKELSD